VPFVYISVSLGHFRKTAKGNTSIIASMSTSKHSWLTPVIGNILIVETGERFAYFGFRAILVLYFTSALAFTDTQAISYFAYTTCLAYFSPIAGALLADGFLGRYRTIYYFGICYVLGLAVLTTAACGLFATLSAQRWLSFAGLFLVCLGTGGIKPCVSSFGADQLTMTAASNDDNNDDDLHLDESTRLGEQEQDSPTIHSSICNHQSIVDRTDEAIKDVPTLSSVDPREKISTMGGDTTPGNDEHVRQYFAWFYFCINVGALTSIALVPLIKGRYGFGPAFLLPFVFMVCAMLLFVSKKSQYKHSQPGDTSMWTTFVLCWQWIRYYFSMSSVGRTFPFSSLVGPVSSPESPTGRSSYLTLLSDPEDDEGFFSETRSNRQVDDAFTQQLRDAAQVFRILPIMATFPIFWCLYDQQASVWTLQAGRMGLMGLQPEQMTLINPLEIMVFIPLFDQYIYPAMQARSINLDPLRRISWGMALAALSFLMSSWVEDAIQYRLDRSLPKINVLWQLPQLTVLSVGEIFLSVTSLEFAYAESPDRLKAFVTSLYLLTTAVGDLIGGILYSTVFSDVPLGTVMRVCAMLMVVNLGLFLLVKQNWNRHRSWRPASTEELEFHDRNSHDSENEQSAAANVER
jgi:dipeptide/tripeptide permease